MPDYLNTSFWCILLFLKCFYLIHGCANSYYMSCYYDFFDDFLNVNSGCSSNDTNWYFSDVKMLRIEDLPEIEPFVDEDNSKIPFQYLDISAHPFQRISKRSRICANLCINISREDIMDTDWMNLTVTVIPEKLRTIVVNITTPQENCTHNEEPFGIFCIWSYILEPTGGWKIQLKIETENSSAKFRFRLPDWSDHIVEGIPEPCQLEPFIYFTSDNIYVKLENCSKLLNLTIKDSNNNTISKSENIDLSEKLTLDWPSNYDYNATLYSKIVFLNDTTGTIEILLNQTRMTESPAPDTDPERPSKLLLYLTPFILCIVLTIVFLILRPELKFMWKKITRQGENTKPTVKFLYCKCSGHSVYVKQLKPLLHFIERYCNVSIENLSEKEYDDTEALLQRRHQDTDYVILIPMPEFSTTRENQEEECKNTEEIEEFKNAKGKKRIILQVPFEGIGSEINCGCTAANFKLMDDFIPFIQHLHQKYSGDRRYFLTVDKIMDIKQKLEDNHLTDGGFELLSNQFTDDSSLQNSKINSCNFPDLNDLKL